MNNIRLLDCTLRDGGYINDWHFGYLTIKRIIEKLTESSVDYIEVGFLRDCGYEKNKAVFNNCAEIANVIPKNKGNTLFTAMALHNKYDIAKLEPYDGKTVDAIRVTFHDYDITEGLDYISKVKEKGYKVFVNPINIMGYSDMQILELLERVNAIKPYAFSIVDTFGSLMKEDLLRIYSIIEHNLDSSIVIGLHLHENLALSYSLAQEFVSIKSSERKCIIDASMLGMGRSPGNLCMELIMDYMNKKQGTCYNVNSVLDGIDDYIIKFKKVEAWGYSTAYALSAKYNLHRNYAEFLIDKGRLSAKQINQILGSIEDNKKTAYDENYIENIYQSFQNRAIDDSQVLDELKKEITERNILILAPGANILTYKSEIDVQIRETSPIIIAANFVPESYQADYVFYSNERRYDAARQNEGTPIVLVTSNLLAVCGEKTQILNYSDLYFDEKGNCDNCVIMLFKLLIKLKIQKVMIAGFDGYKEDGNNYVQSYMANQHTKGREENININGYMKDIRKQLEIIFLTPSLFDVETR